MLMGRRRRQPGGAPTDAAPDADLNQSAHGVLARIIVLVVVSDMGIGMVAPLWALRARDMGMSVGMVGAMVAFLGVGRLFTSFAGGLASDRWGRRRVLVIGFAGLALAAVGGGLTPVPELFFPLRVVEGIGWELMAVSASTAVADLARGRDRQGTFFTRYTAARRGSQAAAPVLGGLLTVVLGITFAFYVYAALAAVSAIAAWRLLPPLPARLAPAEGPDWSARPGPHPGGWLEVRNLVTDAGFGSVATVSFLLTGADLAVQQFLVPTLGANQGMSALQIGAALAAYGVLISLVSLYAGGRLIDRLGPRLPLWAGAAVAALGYALVPVLQGLPGMVAAMVIAGTGRGLTNGAPTVLLLRRFPGRQGRVQGVFRTVSGVGRLVTPVALGAAGAALTPAVWGLAAALVGAGTAMINLTARTPANAVAVVVAATDEQIADGSTLRYGP